jgi:hypothetical protein
MSADDALNLVRAHDPATRLAPLPAAQRDELRDAIVSSPLEARNGARRPRRGLPRRRTLALVVACVVMLGAVGGGIAARGLFKSPAEEEQGLPDGSAMFIGTHPVCTRASDVQFHCVLQSTPTVEYIEGSYLGSKMLSVDATKHIDGGCIATSEDGLVWDCYLGQAAVDHDILAASLLGEYQPGPSHG